MAPRGWEPDIGGEPRASWVSQKPCWGSSDTLAHGDEEKCVEWMKTKNLGVILKVVGLERGSEKPSFLSPPPHGRWTGLREMAGP